MKMIELKFPRKTACAVALLSAFAFVSASFAVPTTVVSKRDMVLNLEGQAGGDVDASSVSSPYGPCSGKIGKEPNHIIEFKEYGLYAVRVTSEADLTLVVYGPSENLCGDDFGKSKNPQVDIPTTGVFKIHVGSKDGKPYPYKIHIENSAG